MKNKTDTLNDTIGALQNKSEFQWKELKEQFEDTMETLKPFNMVKSLFKQITTSPEIKGNILDSAIGLGAGYLTKKVIIGNSPNPIKQLAGILLQFVVGNVISKHTDEIKSKAEVLYRTITSYRNQSEAK